VPDRPDIPPALRALLETGGALVRRSSTGRTLLGRTSGLLRPPAYPAAMRPVTRVLDDARSAAAAPLDRKTVSRAGRELDSIESEPLAVTPLGAVHRGVAGGEAVAVRIRRPDIDTGVRNDLALLDLLAPAVSAVFRALDTGAILRSIRERSLDELDFEHEAATQRSVARAMRGVAGLEVAAAHGEHSGPEVLVTAFVSGPTLADAAPADPGAVARALVTAHVRAALAGLAPVDLRPNHVVLTDGGCVLLGAGNAAAVDRERSEAFLDALAALREADEEAFVTVLVQRLSLLPDAAARQAFALMRQLIGDLVEGPALLDDAAVAAMGERTLARLGAIVALGAEVTPHPGDLWLARMAGQLTAVLARLDETQDWAALALEARR
jgi:predicted unusual protein kinase regulating ubiquinone biosynthesis (AarF/ABC1/UbiB family)